MKCPKCQIGDLLARNTYSGSNSGVTRKRKCSNCGTVFTTQELVVHVTPRKGQGAFNLARHLQQSGDSRLTSPAPLPSAEPPEARQSCPK